MWATSSPELRGRALRRRSRREPLVIIALVANNGDDDFYCIHWPDPKWRGRRTRWNISVELHIVSIPLQAVEFLPSHVVVATKVNLGGFWWRWHYQGGRGGSVGKKIINKISIKIQTNIDILLSILIFNPYDHMLMTLSPLLTTEGKTQSSRTSTLWQTARRKELSLMLKWC